MRIMTPQHIAAFAACLAAEERAPATIAQYTRALSAFVRYLCGREVTKQTTLVYKAHLITRYSPAGVNAALSALNRFFAYMEWHDLRVKNVKIQKQIFAPTDQELTKPEYDRLLAAAKQQKNDRLYLLMQTICSTGIRVSELRYITTEAVHDGVAEITGKGKRRRVFLPQQLCRLLRRYSQEQGIRSGAVFVTRTGRPLDRSNIWSDMKKLCRAAHVPETKVFPHNLSHLFARTYYSAQKDIVRLADILGHASINTTRIYTMESGDVHRRQIQKLGLVHDWPPTTDSRGKPQ